MLTDLSKLNKIEVTKENMDSFFPLIWRISVGL